MYRCALLAALRSKKLNGATVGVMITASHNPEQVSLSFAIRGLPVPGRSCHEE